MEKSLVTKVLNLKGEELKNIELSENLFQVPLNITLLKEVIEHHENNKRCDAKHGKNRTEVNGTNRKVWKQKGSGRARHSDRKANLFRGGGMYDTTKSSHSYSIPKKKKAKAIAMILTKKFTEGTFYVMDQLKMNVAKTKLFINDCFLKDALFIDDEFDKNFLLSMRNLYKYKALNLNGLNSLYLLKSKAVVFSESALKKLGERYAK